VNTSQSYKIENVAGCAAFVALVAGVNPGGCNVPAGENASGFVEFSTNVEPRQGEAVAVVRGRCQAIAAGAITHGHWVRIADNTGAVEDCQVLVDGTPETEINVIGKAETDAATAGAPIVVTTQEFVVKP
jgi:hypothetical protein